MNIEIAIVHGLNVDRDFECLAAGGAPPESGH
jgi:hypothetical protein